MIYLTNLQKKVRIPRKRLLALAKKVARGERLKGDLSVVFVADAEISRINRQFLGRRGPTDVISFPLADGHDRLTGEILISAETARREAALRRIPLQRELGLYVAHGILHLCGYDDTTPHKAKKMREREAYYMKGL